LQTASKVVHTKNLLKSKQVETMKWIARILAATLGGTV